MHGRCSWPSPCVSLYMTKFEPLVLASRRIENRVAFCSSARVSHSFQSMHVRSAANTNENGNVLSPFLCRPFNTSFEHGSVPPVLSRTVPCCFWRKQFVDALPDNVKYCRRITKLSVVCKLLATTCCAQQLLKYLTENGLLPDLQSTYRANRSTGSAVMKVLADSSSGTGLR